MRFNSRKSQENGVSEQGGQDMKQILEKISMQLEKLESQAMLENETTTVNKTPIVSKETAGQVLAQSQMKLTQELEVTLEALQRVISESEKIAGQIENLLGQSADDNST